MKLRYIGTAMSLMCSLPCGAGVWTGCSSGEVVERTPEAQVEEALQVTFDDRYTTLATDGDVTTQRALLMTRIWGSSSLPGSFPTATKKTAAQVGAAIPAILSNLDTTSVYQFDFPTLNPMPPNNNAGGTGMAFLLLPVHDPRHRVVILNTGHTNTFDQAESEDGMRNVVQTLLTEGYAVVLMYMPHFTPSDNSDNTKIHDEMFSDGPGTDEPHDAKNFRYFVEPSIIAANWLFSGGAPGGPYSDVTYAGLSGGGFTTTVLAALDPRAQISVAIAGNMPGYIETEGSIDAEQYVYGRLGIGYADLYVLGAKGTATAGTGGPRRLTHVLNRFDSCCFGQAAAEYDSHGSTLPSWQNSMRLTERNVRTALYGIGTAGRFRLEIDEMADHHMVSANTLQNVLLAELDGDRRIIGAASTSSPMFYRGLNGNMWRRTFPNGGTSIETDTGVAIAGVPVVVEGGPHAVDVFVRDAMAERVSGASNLIHYYPASGLTAWTQENLPGFMLSDPAATAGAGTYDVISLSTEGQLYRLASGAPTFELVNSGTYVGVPAVVRISGKLHVIARGKNLSIYHLYQDGAGWTQQELPAVLSGFPTAAVSGTMLFVAGLGTDSNLYVGTLDSNQVWSGWSQLVGNGSLFAGSPSFGTNGSNLTLFARTATGSVGRFIRVAGTWSYADWGGSSVVSPTALMGSGDAVASGNQAGALWYHAGTPNALGGLFD